jgi:alkanesulfonate monooxygenase SsuD/methylene tetrahydromethanopterin reductase-like flavin-dependent oxidoreductase (luciferase family)
MEKVVSSSLEFGLFHEFPRRPGQSENAAFVESLELVDAAEQWGMDVVWVVELHQSTRSVLSSPLTVAAAIAGRTRRIRIGPAVQVLPLANPLRLAEEWATVDQISQGRLIFGVGRASSPRSYLAYGIPYAESRGRFAEALAIIRRAWTEPTLSYDGEYYRYTDAVASPRPYQRPHPPIRVAATSPESFPLLGTQGYPIFAAGGLGNRTRLKHDLDQYRAAYRASGHSGEGEVYIRTPIYVAETMAEAIADPEPSLMQSYRDQATHRDQLAALGVTSLAGRGEWPRERQDDTTYEQALRERIVVGTPDVVDERLRELRDDLGLAGILAELNHGRLIPHERVLRSMRLLCAEVMPRFRQNGV